MAVQNNAWLSRRAHVRRHPHMPPNISSANSGASPRVMVGKNFQSIRPKCFGTLGVSPTTVVGSRPSSDSSHGCTRVSGLRRRRRRMVVKSK